MRRLWAQGAQGYLLLALILCSVSVGRAQVAYTDFGHAFGDTSQYTVVSGMNASRQVVGHFEDSATVIHGFLLSGGSFSRIDAPTVVGNSYPAGTIVNGINDSGQVVGAAQNANGSSHGFLLSGGIYTTIDPPGGSDTYVTAINDSGQMVGFFTGADQQQHGFLYSGGVYTTIDAPGGLAGFGTQIFAINASGQMAGIVTLGDANATIHGFLLSGGSFTIIDPPGSLGTNGVAGLNASGQVVGTFGGADHRRHGYLFSGGSYTIIDPPSPNLGTTVYGINDSGQIAGTYQVSANVSYGFLLSGGSFTTIDPPGAAYALVTAINDSGQMAGEFYDPSITVHVFLASALITLLDPVPDLLNGPAVTTSTDALSVSSLGRQVSGVSADGAIQVVVKIVAPAAGEQYTLTLLNDSNSQSNLPDEDGALANLGASTFVQSQILVTAVNTVNGPRAFAIYRAPVDFARPLNTNDEAAAKRSVSIQVSDSVAGTVVTVPVQIIRPPVALIHGLWSDPSTWDEFQDSLNSNNLFDIYRVNYKSSNFVQVQINERLSLTQLGDFLEQFKLAQGVAAVQFDLIGHSMGGLISRYMVLDPRFYIDGNYKQGWIHKLITIDTPHAGSVIPTLLDESGAACHAVYASAHQPLDGATHDLEPNSLLLQTMYRLPLPPTHAIAGYMTPDQDFAISSLLNSLVSAAQNVPALVCPTLFDAVTPFSFSGLYGGPNDIAVAESSQVYGFSLGVTADVVPGVIHLNVPPIPWLIQMVSPPPGALSQASGNPGRVLNLLNTPPSSGAFRQGITP